MKKLLSVYLILLLSHPAYALIEPSDGKYALILFASKSDYAIRILNTETLTMFTVAFDAGDISRLAAFTDHPNSEYPVAIQFIANDLVIINTESGIRLFRIQ
ncbi:MAG: hypothetical protein IKJ65_00505 [Clostridia bacterium]|nr:hypothetical protein [Clostridia bacterium]